MPSRRCGSHSGGEGGRVSVQQSYMPTKAMTFPAVAKRCGDEGSFRVSRGVAWTRVSG